MDSKQVIGMMEAYASIYEKKGNCVDKKDKGAHNCAKKVCSEQWGEGETIFGQHAVPDENGFVSHYDVQFEHGIVENVSVEDMEVLTMEGHYKEGHRYEGDTISEMDYKDLRSIQESYNSMYSEDFPNVKSSNRAGNAGSAGLMMIDTGSGTGYVNKHSRGNVIPPASVNKIMSGKLMVKGGKPKNKTQLAHYESEGEMVEGMADMVDKASKAAQGGLEKMGVKINRTPRPTARPSVRTQDTMRKNQSSMEEVDVFDIIKGHLIDEGFADTEEAAHSIMASMSEGWKQSIVEAFPNVKGNLGGPNPIDPVTGKSKYKMITDPKTGKPVEIKNPSFGMVKGV